MRLTSFAVCAALVGGLTMAGTAASAQGYGYGYGYGGPGYGYRYQRPWQPDPSDPSRGYRERRLSQDTMWRARAAEAAGDYWTARTLKSRAQTMERRSRIDDYYSRY